MNAQTRCRIARCHPRARHHAGRQRLRDRPPRHREDQPRLSRPAFARSAGRRGRARRRPRCKSCSRAGPACRRRPSCRRSRSTMREGCSTSGMPLLETSFEVGMSGPGRLHDLFVTHEAMSPGDYKTRGAGLTIRYGYPHLALRRGAGHGHRPRACRPLLQRSPATSAPPSPTWPAAGRTPPMSRIMAATAPYAARIFDPSRWRADQPLRVVLIGTDFQVRVWEALLQDPDGQGVQLFVDRRARSAAPTASRAPSARRSAPTRFPSSCPATGRSASRAR